MELDTVRLQTLYTNKGWVIYIFLFLPILKLLTHLQREKE